MDRPEEDELTQAVIALATQYGRYGYRRIAALLRNVGWEVGKDRSGRVRWRLLERLSRFRSMHTHYHHCRAAS